MLGSRREKKDGYQDLNIGLGARRRKACPQDGKELPHEGEGLKTQMWLMLGKDVEG